MPTLISMTVTLEVPVDPKNAIEQATVTQTLASAAEAAIKTAQSLRGDGDMRARVKRTKDAAAPTPPGDTPETMPVSLPL